MSRRHGIAGVLVVLALVAVLIACDDAADLSEGPGNVGVAALVEGADRTTYEQASVTLQQVEIRPVDPIADEGIGPRPIALLPASVKIDLNSSATVTVPSFPLNEGEYRVSRLTLSAVTLVNENPADPEDPAVPCLDKIADFPGYVTVPGTLVIEYSDPDTAPIVWVPGDGGESRIQLTIDSEGLIERYVSAFLCRDTSSCVNARPGPGEPAPPPPCIDLFNLDGTFEGDLPDYVDIAGVAAAGR